MKEKLHNRTELNIFEQIIKGDLQPNSNRNNNLNNQNDLVKKINKIILDIHDKQIHPVKTAVNFKSLGYYSIEDFAIIPVSESFEDSSYYIEPVKIYHPVETIIKTKFNSDKINSYLELIFDEFERIKIRVEYVHDEITDPQQLKNYVTKNIQKAKKLIEESKSIVASLSSMQSLDCMQILSIASKYLIETISFIQTMFIHSIDFEPEDVELLTLRLQSHAYSIHTRFFNHPDFQILINKIPNQYEKFENIKSLEKSFLHPKTQNNSQPSQSQGFVMKVENCKLIWDNQINILVDGVVQLVNGSSPNKSKVSEVSLDFVKTFICSNFLDKNGNNLSPYTIQTYLKPYRTDKKVHPENPKRIDLSNSLNLQ